MRAIYFIVLTFLTLSFSAISILAAPPNNAPAQATQLLYSGIQKFTPCNVSSNSLRNECFKGCNDRCLLELKPSMQEKAVGECNKMCNDHCGQLVSQSHVHQCDLNGALNDMNKAFSLDSANPNILINRAYVKMRLAKDMAFDHSDSVSAVKTLNSAMDDSQEAKQLFTSLKDDNGSTIAENAITVIQNNILFLKNNKK